MRLISAPEPDTSRRAGGRTRGLILPALSIAPAECLMARVSQMCNRGQPRATPLSRSAASLFLAIQAQRAFYARSGHTLLARRRGLLEERYRLNFVGSGGFGSA
jgi:hypothetical protein